MGSVKAIIERENSLGFVALCAELDIASQGETVEEAQKNLTEAVELFFECASAEEIQERLQQENSIIRIEEQMSNLRVLSGNECCPLLALHGFMEVRRKGSHIIMQKRLETTTITVPVPDHKELHIGTLQSIIRQSGVAKNVFENL